MARSGWFPRRRGRRTEVVDDGAAAAPAHPPTRPYPGGPPHGEPGRGGGPPAGAPGSRGAAPGAGGAHGTGAHAAHAQPAAPGPRYPWHDDPYYDPAQHRRVPPPAGPWRPPPGGAPPPPSNPPGLPPSWPPPPGGSPRPNTGAAPVPPRTPTRGVPTGGTAAGLTGVGPTGRPPAGAGPAPWPPGPSTPGGPPGAASTPPHPGRPPVPSAGPPTSTGHGATDAPGAAVARPPSGAARTSTGTHTTGATPPTGGATTHHTPTPPVDSATGAAHAAPSAAGSTGPSAGRATTHGPTGPARPTTGASDADATRATSHPAAPDGTGGHPTDATRATGHPTPGTAQPPGPGPTGGGPADRGTPRPRGARAIAGAAGKLTRDSARAFHRAASADGADRSGLTALTYATMFTYAVDAAVAVALANTLFFAAATAESKTNVALYLAITVAPFAVVAPVIGPLLDRLQRGRRAALAASFVLRGVLAIVMAYEYDSWLLYPAALGVMVLSKSFVVLKAAVTPRVLPPSITLVTTNSRLTTFGLAAGAASGAVAAGVAWMLGSPGALAFTALLALTGAALCLRIPAWVESTEGEAPATLRAESRERVPIGRSVLIALWGNGSVRVLTGFLTLFVAFVVKAQTETDPGRQLLLIGVVGAAAGVGSFAGNAVGSRARFAHSDAVLLGCVAVPVLAAVVAALLPGIASAAVVGLLAATCSAVAKVCLDAVIQRDLPERSRASAFGRSETVLQLAWVFGGAMGVLLPHTTWWIGFAVVAGVVTLGGVQTALLSRGGGLPWISPGPAASPAA